MRQAQQRTNLPVEAILDELGLSSATHYRWQARELAGRLTDVVVLHQQVLLPLPQQK